MEIFRSAPEGGRCYFLTPLAEFKEVRKWYFELSLHQFGFRPTVYVVTEIGHPVSDHGCHPLHAIR